MPNVATWIRPKDDAFFQEAFAPYPAVKLHNAADAPLAMAEMDGLLLTGGPDIALEFLRQEVPDPSVIDKDVNEMRDRWEFEATAEALERHLPIFGICKGLQVLNVALGGTLLLDIPGHDGPQMRFKEVQELRNGRAARHRFEKVNSSHHQAIDRLGDGLEAEAWCAKDDIIEMVRLKNYPFALAVQYHPERNAKYYAALFADFVSRLNDAS